MSFNSTAGVLRQIKKICADHESCLSCPFSEFDSVCNSSPQNYSEENIEEMADIIDDYE